MRDLSRPVSRRATGAEGSDGRQRTRTIPIRPAQLNSTIAVDLAGVHKWYGDFHVLRDINLRVARASAS